MRKLLFILMLTPGLSFGGPCEKLDQLAATIMEHRQYGTPMAELTKQVDDSDLGKALVKDAYDRTRWHTESSKERAITDFRNDVYNVCKEQ